MADKSHLAVSKEKQAGRARATRMDRDERVLRILAAARDCFCARGYEAAVVSEISRSLGVSEATIFKYFPTKRDLLNQVIEHWYGQMFGDYSKELAVISGARNRFRYLAWRHLRTIRDSADMCRLVFRELRSQPGYAASPVFAMNKRYAAMFVDVIREGVRDGEFRQGMPMELLRDIFFGAMEHHAWSYLYGEGSLNIEKVADQLSELICSGIAVSPATERVDEVQRLSTLIDRLERTAKAFAKLAKHTD